MIDCARRSIARRGISGLYRGLIPNVIGVVPEKAIKLAVNAQLREILKDARTGKVSLGNELLAGGLTGLAQAIATTPMEAVKIQMQTSTGLTPVQILKELGVCGLYRGTAATLLRDIPFSMLFFTANSVSRERIAVLQECTVDELSLSYSLSVGMLSGAIAAVAATPADVIKTRVQAKSEPGRKVYGSIYATTKRIFKEEGASAFFKGSLPRALVTGPLFGIALLSYDVCARSYHACYDRNE